jgi:hypothetical protein
MIKEGALSNSGAEKQKSDMADEVLDFVEGSGGLVTKLSDSSHLCISQKIDQKQISFSKTDLTEVLSRVDSDGRKFLQLNFNSGLKILLTDALVGFKPVEVAGLDMGRIPKVVTTPDLLSVFEALEDSLATETSENEIETLKKVFFAILGGGESVGFDLAHERKWISRLIASRVKYSA